MMRPDSILSPTVGVKPHILWENTLERGDKSRSKKRPANGRKIEQPIPVQIDNQAQATISTDEVLHWVSPQIQVRRPYRRKVAKNRGKYGHSVTMPKTVIDFAGKFLPPCKIF
jgi:hypothetical protein